MQHNMQSENQITTSKICTKKLPDYAKYDALAENNIHLKKYLAFERYVLAKHLKMEGCTNESKNIIHQIDDKYLNYKQRLLLFLPNPINKMLTRLKNFFIKKGIKIATYSN